MSYDPWADETARKIIAARIASDTGIDGYAARAMVDDVRQRGADSPYAAVVGAAANAVIKPVADAVNEFFRGAVAWLDSVGRVLTPVFDSWRPALAAEQERRSV